MKKYMLLFIAVLVQFSSCELLDLTYKQVDYVIDSQKEYVYVAMLSPGEFDKESRFMDRSTFDIPFDATIETFLVKNIFLNIEVSDQNICDEIIIVYAYDILNQGSDIDGHSSVSIDLPDDFVEDILLNNNFNEPFSNIRAAISEAIKSGKAIEFQFGSECNEEKTTDITMTIILQVIAEYQACEQFPSDTDLPDC